MSIDREPVSLSLSFTIERQEHGSTIHCTHTSPESDLERWDLQAILSLPDLSFGTYTLLCERSGCVELLAAPEFINPEACQAFMHAIRNDINRLFHELQRDSVRQPSDRDIDRYLPSFAIELVELLLSIEHEEKGKRYSIPDLSGVTDEFVDIEPYWYTDAYPIELASSKGTSLIRIRPFATGVVVKDFGHSGRAAFRYEDRHVLVRVGYLDSRSLFAPGLNARFAATFATCFTQKKSQLLVQTVQDHLAANRAVQAGLCVLERVFSESKTSKVTEVESQES